MRLITPQNHRKANKVWRELLHSKPNGARTLGTAGAKYLSSVFEPYYDMFVTYAPDIEFPIPNDVKKIAVMWHQNFPWVAGITKWRMVNNFLGEYEVDYFCNENHIVELIQESGGNAYYLPRFIDTTTLPKPSEDKYIPNLWFGNRWAEFATEFERYKREVEKPYWISGGKFGKGEEVLYDINRRDSLEILNHTSKVWAIGISQLEARYFGADIVSYRDEPHKYYDQNTIVEYAERLLDYIHSK